MTQYLGIDIGTTRTKVGCYDSSKGALIAIRHAPTPVSGDPWGGVRDAVVLVGLVRRLLDALLNDDAVRARELAGVAVGSVGEEIVLLDASGGVTGPVLTWHAAHGREAAAGLPSGPWDGMDDTFSVFKLVWLARHRAEELSRATTFTDLADFVAGELMGSGGAETFLNVSHSSRTGLVDLNVLRWRGGLLADLGAANLTMPELVSSGTTVGHTVASGRLPGDLPVVAGGHDHWCGAFGAGVRRAGDVYVSAGTSEAQVMLVNDLPGEQPPGVDVGAFVVDDLRYLHRATPSGRFYQSWHDILYAGVNDLRLWDEVDAVAGAVAAAEVDADLRTVHLAPLPIDTTSAYAMASLMKGLAVEAERTTQRLEKAAGRAAVVVTVAGVPATNPTWRRLRQEATDRDLRFVVEPEATLLGVALLAQHGVEGHSDFPLGGPTPEGAPA